MARIKDEDVAAVRAAAQMREVVGDYVTLKSAGGGSYKGLCPFHDERTPSFHVTPAKGLYHCFSCQEGGDLITFVRKVEGLTFTEAIEKLAARYGVTLRYEEGGGTANRGAGQRSRLVAANAMAAAFFSEALAGSEAQSARDFLLGRGFPEATWSQFGVGYAPKGWDSMTSRLRANGYSDEEMLAAGLVSQGQRGVYDRFRGRLVWPIRDTSGEVLGFGARKLYDDDEGPKYLNTPETPVYKKSQVLYGLDLARRDIARKQQVVIVEGYTDVMACHLAGVTTAVATCGTAFGAEHVKVMRRLLLDSADSGAEVVFTFDGDAAGQKAAMRAFDQEQRFVTQTFVAVAADGLDPCDLRLSRGDAAVQELVRSRIPMFEFAIRTQLRAHDLETAEGRVSALRDCAPIVAGIKDSALRPEYVRQLSGWLGMDEARVSNAVTEAFKRAPRPTATPPARPAPAANSGTAGRASSGVSSGAGSGAASSGGRAGQPGPTSTGVSMSSGEHSTNGASDHGVGAGGAGGQTPGGAPHLSATASTGSAVSSSPDSDPPASAGAPGGFGSDVDLEPAARVSYGRPDPEDRTIAVQKEALGCALQVPHLVASWYESVEETAFTWVGFVQVHRAIAAAGKPSAVADFGWGEEQWLAEVLNECADDTVRTFVRELATRPLPATQVTEWYATSIVARLLEYDTLRQIADMQGRLQRLQSDGASDVDGEQMQSTMATLSALEGYRRQLRDVIAGEV